MLRLTTVEVKVTDRMNCDVTKGGHVGSTAVNIHCCQRMCDIVDTVTHEKAPNTNSTDPLFNRFLFVHFIYFCYRTTTFANCNAVTE